jgi:hypothetical protein
MGTVEAESYDAVSVSAQGAYLAKRCPEAVQLDVVRPVEPLPMSDFMTMLAEAGIAFEKAVFDSLRPSKRSSETCGTRRIRLYR